MNKILIYGAGVSGRGAEKLAQKEKIEYLLIDDKKGFDDKKLLSELNQYDLLIKSPGISFGNKIIKKAKEINIKIIDEIEFAFAFSKSKIIAITGTNGKTTTTTKIKEMLDFSGYSVSYAGNIGNSFAELIAEGKETEYVILELSSYQLEGIKKFKPYIAMVINLTPDHLNRYESLNEYYKSKMNIFKNQSKEDYAIINADDKEMLSLYNKDFKAKQIKVSKENKDVEIYVENGKIYVGKEEILEVKKLGLKGIHNLENVLFIVSVANILGIESKKVRGFLYNTKGLEHRMEEFYKIENTVFINDSKGTNVDATIKALNSYEDKVVLITGGKDKKLDLEELLKTIMKKSKKVFLIGETANKIENGLIKKGYKKANLFNIKRIDKIREELSKKVDFKKENIVLFSPAASSFDQFQSYQKRGEIFKKIIKN
ncbi:MAG: UDP-N-acetylmuramoyl-L-alanine--D-glutamate ligase [Fusobacteriia bacterium 4572_132]|nr:MAG: UDP-N-acetylmuramoyl-L-alanine--D-glutamate ligase [Fusobacteriia bacterium 4572_132]